MSLRSIAIRKAIIIFMVLGLVSGGLGYVLARELRFTQDLLQTSQTNQRIILDTVKGRLLPALDDLQTSVTRLRRQTRRLRDRVVQLVEFIRGQGLEVPPPKHRASNKKKKPNSNPPGPEPEPSPEPKPGGQQCVTLPGLEVVCL